MSDETVLVIAADAAFRHSLVFLFEAEGFDVTAVPDVESASGSRSRCAVVDDASVLGDPDFWPRLSTVSSMFVVLLSNPRELPAGFSVLAVEKPILGEKLVDTVRSALLRSPAST